jgi:hypothetical protein
MSKQNEQGGGQTVSVALSIPAPKLPKNTKGSQYGNKRFLMNPGLIVDAAKRERVAAAAQKGKEAFLAAVAETGPDDYVNPRREDTHGHLYTEHVRNAMPNGLTYGELKALHGSADGGDGSNHMRWNMARNFFLAI